MKKRISPMRVRRFFAQISLDELSRLTSIEKSKLSRIENGWIIPTDRERRRIARALRTKQDELFSLENVGRGSSRESCQQPAQLMAAPKE